jgi:hypothetical protein
MSDEGSLPVGQGTMLVEIVRQFRGQRGAIASVAASLGIDGFEALIPLLSRETGVPISELAESVEVARQCSDPIAGIVPNQHLVSKTVLRRFALNRNGHYLKEYSIANGPRATLTPVRKATVVENFVRLDSASLETTWSRVETPIPNVMNAIASGTLFSQPNLVDVVKNALALHFARSHELLASTTAQYRTPLPLERFLEATGLPRDWILRAYDERYGHSVTDLNYARSRLSVDLERDFQSQMATGLHFRLRIPDLYKAARSFMDRSGIQVLMPAPDAGHFIIGDNPLITPERGGPGIGILDGIPIGNAVTVTMPLSPTVAVALARDSEFIELPDDEVQKLNRLQVMKARHSVYFEPNEDCDEFIQGSLSYRRADRWPQGL